ncbi:hypothetical protein [Wolbachia pipientis]|uniref:hypothetical protein n=1 Tax=Wolbachia pipientis TaxID=955 RepID=UPI002030E1BF|nr:hypothetical protein [Wolbachia pipientis]
MPFSRLINFLNIYYQSSIPDPSIKCWDDKKKATWMTPITLSFQRVTLESRNFIGSVSINVMLKYTILWKTEMTS